MKAKHRDKVLDELIGKRVKLVDFENEEFIGELYFPEKIGYYAIRCENKRYNYAFRKSHYKKVEELQDESKT